jgi:hypothetical protein
MDFGEQCKVIRKVGMKRVVYMSFAGADMTCVVAY